MSKRFSETEKHITSLFKKGEKFIYNSNEYEIVESGKPLVSKGECKTDTFIRVKNENEKYFTFKISIKQVNADFIENKMNFERAVQIFGERASSIISESLESVKDDFENDYLVTIDKYKRTEAKTIKIGWKFELLNVQGGLRSGKMALDKNQILDVYAGTNLSDDKKNAYVNGKQIQNSGVANCIFEAELNKAYTLQEVINQIVPIKTYIQDKELYFACKAVNYRASKSKWDGNRPLSAYVDWKLTNNSLRAKIVYSDPLRTTANTIGKKICEILETLNIDKDNFENIESYLANINYYKNPS